MAKRVALGIINSTTSGNSTSLLVRTTTGSLYAITGKNAGNATGPIQVFLSTDNGSTWAIQDYGNAPTTVGTSSAVLLACSLDGNNNIHIAFGGVALTRTGYVQFSTATNTFGLPLYVNNTNAASINGISIAIDSNNIPHLAATFTGNFVGYTNLLKGYLTPYLGVESTTTSIPFVEIIIDQNNVPQIVVLGSTNGVIAYLGNKNNASSFNRTVLASSAASSNTGVGIVIDYLSNTWITYQAAKDGPILLAQHKQKDAWATWQTAITNGYSGKSVSLAADQNDIYIFYERNAGGIAYDRYDTINGKWLGETIVQANTSALTTNKQWHNPFVKWSTYFNNGDTGANNQSQDTIEYLFDDGTTVYYDKLVTAQISVGFAEIKFSAQAGATTTSTSSTSSSTSVSTSTSSTSTSQSTSISTSISSTSQSTSVSTSTSSTSSSISTSTSVSSTSASTSRSTSTSSTSQSTSISTSVSTTSQSTSTSVSSTSQSTSISTSLSTSISSTSSSTTQSFTTSTSSTSSSVSTSSTSSSVSTSISTSSTSTSRSTSTSSTSQSTSQSTSISSTSQSTSISTSTSSTSNSTSLSTSSTSSSTSKSTSTSSTSQSTTTSLSTSTSTTTVTTTSTSSTSVSTSSTSTSLSTTTTLAPQADMIPRITIIPDLLGVRV